MKPIQCLTNLQKHIPDIVQYSGRYLFRLGKYHQCISTPSMDYFFINLGQKATNDQSLFYGACLPSACSNETVHLLINAALDSVKIPLQAKSVQTGIGSYQYNFTWPFFFTFFILTFLLALVMIATLSSKSRQSKLIGAFSIQQSSKIFNYSPGSRLNVLNGIRSLSMFWVIYGHSMSMSIGYSQNIITIEKNILNNWKFLTVSGGLYSVDIFFFVGGFLVAYAFLKQKALTKVKYLLAILNRILRLIPSYFVAIMLYYAVFPHLGRGPFWKTQIKLSELCSSIWRPLLFVDNLVQNGDNMCMGWGWYLQNDLQLFLFSMVILLIFIRSKFWGYFSIFIAMVCNFFFVMQQTFENNEKWLNHMSDSIQSQKYQLDIYFKPWGRCPPYLYGLLLGIFYSEYLNYEGWVKKKGEEKEKILKQQSEERVQIELAEQEKEPFLHKMKQLFVRKAWVRRLTEQLGLIICLFICFIPRTNQGQRYWPQFVHSFYLTYGKLAFVFGISLIILPSVLLPPDNDKNSKNKLFVRFVLDTKFFNFIAKVSFCTYLVHLTLLLIYFGSTSIDFYYTFLPVFVVFVAFSILSVIAGMLLVYLVEAPFSRIQREIIKRITVRIAERNKNKREQLNEESANEANLDKNEEKEVLGK